MELRLKRVPDGLYFFGILRALSALPRQLGYGLARRLGGVLAGNHPETASRVLQNSQATLGQTLSPWKPETVVEHFFQHLACEDLDSYYYTHWNESNLDTYLSFSGLQHLDDALLKGRGALLLTGHVGALCAALAGLGVRGYPVTHVVRDYTSERIPGPFKRFGVAKLKRIEDRTGLPMILTNEDDPPKQAEAILRIQTALRKNQCVSMALDVDPAWVEGRLPVRFLGRQAVFAANLVRIAQACRVPVIPYFAQRDSSAWWHHHVRVGSPVEVSQDLSRSLQECVVRLEEAILRDPAQWFSLDSLTLFWTDP